MNNGKFISEEEYSLARPANATPAGIYGLSKFQKADRPLKPVVSATKTVAYGLGKMLTRRLDHLGLRSTDPCVG
jgi:hypothetical protein